MSALHPLPASPCATPLGAARAASTAASPVGDATSRLSPRAVRAAPSPRVVSSSARHQALARSRAHPPPSGSAAL
eukprot:3387662-Pleurochrysis_carterae.AAC.1